MVQVLSHGNFTNQALVESKSCLIAKAHNVREKDNSEIALKWFPVSFQSIAGSALAHRFSHAEVVKSYENEKWNFKNQIDTTSKELRHLMHILVVLWFWFGWTVKAKLHWVVNKDAKDCCINQGGYSKDPTLFVFVTASLTKEAVSALAFRRL
jgi:hypothetical protein